MFQSFSVKRKGVVQITATVHGNTLIVFERTPEAAMLAPNWRVRLRELLVEHFTAENTPHRLSPKRSEVIYVDISTCTSTHPKYTYFMDNVQDWVEGSVLYTMFGDEWPRRLRNEAIIRAT